MLQIVVHNLPWSVSTERLQEVFERFGAIESDVQLDDMGRSRQGLSNVRRIMRMLRGYGVVRFADKESAMRAIEEMHNQEFDGRNVMVRYDRYA